MPKIGYHECGSPIEYRGKYKDQDEDVIYVFYCSKCDQEILTEYPCIYTEEDLK